MRAPETFCTPAGTLVERVAIHGGTAWVKRPGEDATRGWLLPAVSLRLAPFELNGIYQRAGYPKSPKYTAVYVWENGEVLLWRKTRFGTARQRMAHHNERTTEGRWARVG